MTKLVVVAALAIAACRMLLGYWPWQLWARSQRSQAEAQARALLGVDRQAGHDAIVAAHRRLVARVHPDRGGSADQVHAATAARDLLIERLNRTGTSQ